MSSLLEKVQDFLEADLKRPITSAELKVLRRFVTDFQNAKDEKPKEKGHGEIVSEPWRPQTDASRPAEGDIKPVVKTDSKLFSRVDAWAKMASTADAVSPRSGGKPADLPVEVGIKDRLGNWKEKEEAKEGAAAPRKTSGAAKPADLPVEVGIKDRLGGWKEKEAGKTSEVAGGKSPRDKPADLEVDVGMRDRLGSWKAKEEGKAAAQQSTGKPADLPVEVGIKDRLGKWKDAEEGKAATPPSDRKAPVKLVVEGEDGPAPEAAPLRARLASYQQTVEEKEKAAARARDAKTEVAEATPVSARKDKWAQVTETSSVSKTVDVTKEETVATAPKLKDRLNAFSQAAAEKPIDKQPVVVPYDDDYQPPQLPGDEQPSSVPRKEPVKVEGASSLKDRMESYAHAAEEKPIEKKPVVIEEEAPEVQS